jgi:hypothetical protein
VLEGHITIGCDGQGAITVANSKYKSKSSHKHFYIINSIKTSIQQSPVQWTFCHINGHQDNIIDFNDLDRLAQLNVYTDHIAKRKLLSSIIQSHNWSNRHPQHLPYKTIEIYWTDCYYRKHTKICSQLNKSLTNKIYSTSFQKYWIKKSKFSLHTESYTDWDTSKKSRLGLTNFILL